MKLTFRAFDPRRSLSTPSCGFCLFDSGGASLESHCTRMIEQSRRSACDTHLHRPKASDSPQIRRRPGRGRSDLTPTSKPDATAFNNKLDNVVLMLRNFLSMTMTYSFTHEHWRLIWKAIFLFKNAFHLPKWIILQRYWFRFRIQAHFSRSHWISDMGLKALMFLFIWLFPGGCRRRCFVCSVVAKRPEEKLWGKDLFTIILFHTKKFSGSLKELIGR